MSKGQKVVPWRALVHIFHTQINASPKSEKEHHYWLPCEILPKMHISYVQFGGGMLKQQVQQFGTFESDLNLV